MKLSLLDLLACPGCGHPGLELHALSTDTSLSPAEILAGALSCRSCGRSYPIFDGIPRMLPDSWEEHAERLASLAAGAAGAAASTKTRAAEIRDFRRLHGATRESFGFEWLRYEVTGFEENREFFRRSTGLGHAELAGKRVLDAGCGMGRFLEVAASEGAEVVGIDLSRSVERAWRETRRRPHVHLVQGDLMRPPFVRESFDAVYSIGVLHHTPDTQAAFRSLCPLLRPGGRIAIWVYRSFQPEIAVAPHKRAFAFLAQSVSDGARLVTTRLPHWLLHRLSYAAVPLGWLASRISRHPVLKALFWPLLLIPVSNHEDWRVRVCDTFDWLAPKYQWKHTTREVAGWFAAAGLQDVRALEQSVSVTGTWPGRLAPERSERLAS